MSAVLGLFHPTAAGYNTLRPTVISVYRPQSAPVHCKAVYLSCPLFHFPFSHLILRNPLKMGQRKLVIGLDFGTTYR